MLPSFGHSTKGLTNSKNEKMKDEDMGELFKKRPSGVKAAKAAPAAAAATKPDAKSAAKTKAAAKPASKTVVKSGILPGPSDAKYYFQYHILMK